MFPENRMRRLRLPILKEMIRETTISTSDFIYPIFIDETISEKKEIKSMPGVYRYPISDIIKISLEVIDLGIKSILLFGIPKYKDDIGSSAYDSNGIIQKSIKLLKNDIRTKDKLIIIADLCICEYTTHGHCGVLSTKNNKLVIDNDQTLEILKKIAVSYADSGVDIIAPSGMMDGAVGEIRKSLDKNNYSDVSIMSYSSKFNSSLYGPFRDAADSKYIFGDRSSYQMDIRNSKEALREVEYDVLEGSDFIIVKPGIFYLDILQKIKECFNLPIVSYQVSGEYSMIKCASMNKYLSEEEVFYESFIALKRAGASMIITYYAKEIAKYLNKICGE